MTIRHWGIVVKSHFGDDVGEPEASSLRPGLERDLRIDNQSKKLD